jgi:luciferase-like monooxygenase
MSPDEENALVDEIANELDTWPGVRIGRRDDGAAIVLYEDLQLGVLYPDRAVAELSFSHPEHDALVEHGDAEPADPTPESNRVTHEIDGPSDVTAVLALFDRRYRDLRGADPPFSSSDSG